MPLCAFGTTQWGPGVRGFGKGMHESACFRPSEVADRCDANTYQVGVFSYRSLDYVSAASFQVACFVFLLPTLAFTGEMGFDGFSHCHA